MTETIVETLRAAILAADPSLTEHVKWNAPSFVHNGTDRVTMRMHPKGGVQLIFHRGAKVRDDTSSFAFDDPSGLLAWATQDRGILMVESEEDATAKAPVITDLVRRWVAVD